MFSSIERLMEADERNNEYGWFERDSRSFHRVEFELHAHRINLPFIKKNKELVFALQLKKELPTLKECPYNFVWFLWKRGMAKIHGRQLESAQHGNYTCGRQSQVRNSFMSQTVQWKRNRGYLWGQFGRKTVQLMLTILPSNYFFAYIEVQQLQKLIADVYHLIIPSNLCNEIVFWSINSAQFFKHKTATSPAQMMVDGVWKEAVPVRHVRWVLCDENDNGEVIPHVQELQKRSKRTWGRHSYGYRYCYRYSLHFVLNIQYKAINIAFFSVRNIGTKCTRGDTFGIPDLDGFRDWTVLNLDELCGETGK